MFVLRSTCNSHFEKHQLLNIKTYSIFIFHRMNNIVLVRFTYHNLSRFNNFFRYSFSAFNFNISSSLVISFVLGLPLVGPLKCPLCSLRDSSPYFLYFLHYLIIICSCTLNSSATLLYEIPSSICLLTANNLYSELYIFLTLPSFIKKITLFGRILQYLIYCVY